MSSPSWEEYDGIVPDGVANIDELMARGIDLPQVPDVYQFPDVPDWNALRRDGLLPFLRWGDARKYYPYLSSSLTLQALQKFDAIWSTQVPYLAYLSNRPYLVSQSGGDIWFEASRGDLLGQLMRKSFVRARIFLASNPWSFAHARRFGFSHLIYLPMFLDETVYAPGVGNFRELWKAESGGSFFVLMTSRLDEKNKGSSIALEGFRQFALQHAGARLLAIAWGRDREVGERSAERWGIADRVIWLPLSGKARLREYLRSADCMLDQFVVGYFGATALEAMACGLPVIGRLERDQYDALCETGAPPILQAESATGILHQLVRLSNDEESRKSLASCHREWFMKNHSSQRWLPDYVAVLGNTAEERRSSYRGSPLKGSLSSEERAYHESGLRQAPQFPDYTW